MDIEKAKEMEKHGYKIIYLEKGPHYAKLVDSNGDWVDWIRYPHDKSRRESTRFDMNDILKFHHFNDPFCFFCGRKTDELGVGEGLEIDHIIPIEDGGKDEIGNLQILCTACHKLRHHQNLYITKHLVRKIKNGKVKG